MKDSTPVVVLLAVIAVIGLATAAAQFKWLPERSVAGRILYFLAGAGAVGLLFAAGVPPKWFDGSRTAFALGASLTAGAFLGREGRFFRLPLLLGIGGTLLVLNLLPHF